MPPHLAVLLLLVAPDTHSFNTTELVGAAVIFAFTQIGNLEKLWNWFTGRAKDREEALLQRIGELEEAIGQFVDKDALETRFSGIEGRANKMGVEVANQHNTLMEYERKRTELVGEFRPAIHQLQREVHLLEPMPGRVTNLEAKLDNLTSQMHDLKTGQQELRGDLKANSAEMKQDMRNNKNDILQAIGKITQ